MKCTACQIDVDGHIKEHYLSEIHGINVKRQIYGMPPATIDEIQADDESRDAERSEIQETDAKYPRRINVNENIKTHAVRCIFCDAEADHAHYKGHGMTDNQIECIKNNTCYVCHEGFVGDECLKMHIVSGKHRNTVASSGSLILEDGRVIVGKGAQKLILDKLGEEDASRSRLVVKNEKQKVNAISLRVSKEEQRISANNKNQLKVSLSMNHQQHFKPDWMQ
ncbi:hypothetical protein CWI42_050230 [Ordospora colligata]|nr:hypothetical protein CWI42_050230 [Ordospora colligata]